MVNCYNTFDTLKEVILGDIDEKVLNFCEQDQRNRLTHIVKRTKQDLDQIQNIFESRGIVVHRPSFFENQCVTTPYWDSQGLKIPLTPRDNFLIVGNTIVETASWQKERFFESFYFREIFLSYYNQGANWISMPMPRHDDYDPDPLDNNAIPNRDPMIDAANVIKYGKDLFVSTWGSNNQLGFEWIKKNFSEYRIHPVTSEKITGHLDTHFTIIRPGLLYSYHKKQDLPEYFKNWDILSLDPTHDREISMQQKLYDEKLQDDDFLNTVLGINILVGDPNTVYVYDHMTKNHHFLKQLEKYQIEPVFVPFTYSHFFNQGLTCLTLDTVRETDGCIDYKNS